MATKITAAAGLVLALWLGPASHSLAQPEAGSPAPNRDRLAVSVEALKRLKGQDLTRNAALRSAVLRVLESARGTPYFVEIIQMFQLPGYEAELLDFILEDPSHPMSIEALQLLLQFGKASEFKEAVQKAKPGTKSELLLLASRTPHPAAVDLLLRSLQNPDLDVQLRKTLLRGLAQSETGATALLDLAEREELPAELQLMASMELNSARWPAIRRRAAELLPPPAGRDSQALPPVEELIQRQGDVTQGAAVFQRPEVACIFCHQVGSIGTDYGPALTEIGSKLGKEALFESILDPNAGISFGYEGWEITLKDGQELFGIVVSETADQLTLKTMGGVARVIRKDELETRKKASLSIMPAGLQQAMSVQELVDLIEYMSSLKTPE